MERLVEPIVRDEADFVVGSRRMAEGESADASKARDAGITVYTRLINLIGGTEVSDIANGYRAIRASRLAEIAFTEDQFHNPELLLGAARAGLRVVDVPVTIRKRTAGNSKKGTDLRYGLGFLRVMPRRGCARPEPRPRTRLPASRRVSGMAANPVASRSTVASPTILSGSPARTVTRRGGS
jgi:hypothetical protein